MIGQNKDCRKNGGWGSNGKICKTFNKKCFSEKKDCRKNGKALYSSSFHSTDFLNKQPLIFTLHWASQITQLPLLSSCNFIWACKYLDYVCILYFDFYKINLYDCTGFGIKLQTRLLFIYSQLQQKRNLKYGSYLVLFRKKIIFLFLFLYFIVIFMFEGLSHGSQPYCSRAILSTKLINPGLYVLCKVNDNGHSKACWTWMALDLH